jgi:hypothetical protein
MDHIESFSELYECWGFFCPLLLSHLLFNSNNLVLSYWTSYFSGWCNRVPVECSTISRARFTWFYGASELSSRVSNPSSHLISTVRKSVSLRLHRGIPLFFGYMATLISVVALWLTITPCIAGICQHWFHNPSWILDQSLEYSTV